MKGRPLLLRTSSVKRASLAGTAAAVLLASGAVASSAANTIRGGPPLLRPNAAATTSGGNQPNPLLIVINQNTSNTAGGIYGQDGGTTQFTLGFPFGTAGVYAGPASSGGQNQGVGLFGFGMANGTGVVGLGQSQPGVFGGNTDSNGSSPGVLAVGLNGTGVEGASLGGGSGVVGITSASPPPGAVLAGVSGFDMVTRGSGSGGQNFGVFGQTRSPNSYAIAGVGGNPTSSGTTGPLANGILALAFGGGNGIAAQSIGGSGAAIIGVTDAGNGNSALSLLNTPNGYSFTAAGQNLWDARDSNTAFGGTLDPMGNLTITGTLTTGSGAMINVTRSATGAQYNTYAAHVTRPTQEDVGRGQLVNGNGAVRFDAAFASVIDRGNDYVVFLTPEGDNRGLYVAQRTPSGFVVRESQSGRSTLSFGYRIVATPFASTQPRLPLATGPRTLGLKAEKMSAAARFAAAGRFTGRNVRFPQASAVKLPINMVHPIR